ncbi:hypothetical protein GCK72_018933 [Caenorhabditis remanei]|uniref:T20D4.11-like domain-containing protein n=1 Tax=Caenorhabditis remanei TaxID=31234 RepID=A0A6A5GB67_CAERE|nr:hypothetical protein GCK72_018933 [Caenorhabditis remanei]KAF1752378.1 hypothetical protein GCK72_018933 [Caenorhabditis remanei]
MYSIFYLLNSLVLLTYVIGIDRSKCTPKVLGPKVTKCNETLRHLIEITSDKPAYKKIGKAVLKDCKSFEECSPSLKCLNNSSLDIATENLIANCEAVKYFTVEFSECKEKLKALDSKCLKEWNPFPDDFLKTGEMMNHTKPSKEDCKDINGKDDCGKKQIIETCGKLEWEHFHKV